MLNFPFRQTFYFTLKCNIAVQNIVKKANRSVHFRYQNIEIDFLHVLWWLYRCGGVVTGSEVSKVQGRYM